MDTDNEEWKDDVSLFNYPHSQGTGDNAEDADDDKDDDSRTEGGTGAGAVGVAGKRLLQDVVDTNTTTNQTAQCKIPDIADFPKDLFSQEEREKGYLAIHILVSVYLCIALARVCDYYFVPALEVLCERMNIQPDVAGASLMAIGSSAPELACSLVGVFVTKGDIGLGTILGSAVLNLLFVVGASGIAAASTLQLSWWPITRDSLAYAFTVGVLIIVIFDRKVTLIEAVVMLVLYVGYMIFMVFNRRIETAFYSCTGDVTSYNSRFNSEEDVGEEEKVNLLENDEGEKLSLGDDSEKKSLDLDDSNAERVSETDSEVGKQSEPAEIPFTIPESSLKRVWWAITFPINLFFFITIPDLRRPRCRPLCILTFIASTIWIMFLVYCLLWMVTIIGFTWNISDSVMGLTFVAFGSSVPDILASVFVARDGEGDMAVSQALGSNVFDILLCLGLPWAIMTGMSKSPVEVHDEYGMLFACFVALVLTVIVLLIFVAKGWTLGKRFGVVLVIAYFAYLLSAVLVEELVFKDGRLKICSGNY